LPRAQQVLKLFSAEIRLNGARFPDV